MHAAVNASEQDAVEKTMLEDKLKATDWEATNEAIEEQVSNNEIVSILSQSLKFPGNPRNNVKLTNELFNYVKLKLLSPAIPL